MGNVNPVTARRKPTFQEVYPGYPEPVFEPLEFLEFPPEEMAARARDFYAELSRRRTTRHFSPREVPQELIELAVLSAGTAPSGAHRQPWRFVAVSDPALKAEMREAAEREEYTTYTRRMPEAWRAALAPLGTDYVKEHLTDAPWVVVVFKEKWGRHPDGPTKNYYVTESVGIAVGLFVAAVHHMGLVTLTHTPNPMSFLGKLLGRPENEEAMLVLPVGYPASGAQVPKLSRKPLSDIFQHNRGGPVQNLEEGT